jgi:hypothetical protein
MPVQQVNLVHGEEISIIRVCITIRDIAMFWQPLLLIPVNVRVPYTLRSRGRGSIRPRQRGTRRRASKLSPCHGRHIRFTAGRQLQLFLVTETSGKLPLLVIVRGR